MLKAPQLHGAIHHPRGLQASVFFTDDAKPAKGSLTPLHADDVLGVHRQERPAWDFSTQVREFRFFLAEMNHHRVRLVAAEQRRTVGCGANIPGHVTGRQQRFARFDQQRFVIHYWIDLVDLAGLARWFERLLRPRIEVMIDRPLGWRFYVFGFECSVVGD